MTIQQLLRKFTGLSYLLAVAPVLACSGREDPAEGTGGSGATRSEVIGAFQVGIKAATSEVSVLGRVNDAATPPNKVWEVTQEEGDCQLLVPSAPFCDPGCGADICRPGNVCVPYPEGHSVGEVTLSGVQLMTGESEVVLKEVAFNYQAPPGSVFVFPPFAEGDEIEIHAAGGDYPGFDLVAAAVAPLSYTSNDFALQEDKALELAWDGAGDASASRVHLKLDLSHHGGTKGMVECNTDDDGELVVSAAMMTDLIGLGIAGFPTVELTRVSTASASITPGVIELKVSAFVSEAVSIAGLESCNATSCEGDDDPGCIPCPEGQTCQGDLTCQ